MKRRQSDDDPNKEVLHSGEATETSKAEQVLPDLAVIIHVGCGYSNETDS